MLRPMRPNVLAVAVDCYTGYWGDETPRRFTRGDQLVEILAVMDQWRTPDHPYFTGISILAARIRTLIREVPKANAECS